MTDELTVLTQHRLIEALAASERSARRRLDQLRDIVFETDGAGRLTFLNAAWERLLGFPVDESLGQELAGYLVQADRHLWERLQTLPCPDAASGGATQLRVLTRRGEVRFFEITATWAEPEGLVGALHDITNRKRREQELDDTRSRYRAILDHSSQFVGVLDIDGRLIDVNHTALNFAGVEAADVLGLAFWDTPWWRHSANEQARLREAFGRAVRGEQIRFETTHPAPDGTIRYVDFALKPVTDDQGNVVYLIPEGRDITERRCAEDLFRRVVEASPNALLLVDRQGTIRLANTQAEQWFRYEREELVGRSVDSLVPESVRLRHVGLRESYFRAPVVRGMGAGRELVARRKDGSEFPVEIGLSPIQTESGLMVLSSIVDISERHRSEEALRAAKQAAEKASSAKSEFLSHMSHEIRTPLNGVLSATELLFTSVMTPAQKEYLEIIEASGQTLLAVVNDILDFSKVEAGMLELEKVVFDIRENIDALIRFFGLKAQEKQLEFICDIAPEVPKRIKGDPLRLRQILTNLIGNAIKFTEKGEVTVRVSVAAARQELVTLRFSVDDTGIGIPSDRIDVLFQPFVQVDSSTSRKFGGTGLGLAISGSLVRLMLGETGVVSEAGHGSTFCFTAVFDRVPDESVPEGSVPALQGWSVLLVMPSAEHGCIVKHWLEGWGCRAELVNTMEQAEDALARIGRDGKRFAVVVSDFGAGSGRAAADWISRKAAASRHVATRWVLVAGRSEDEHVAPLCGAGFAVRLNKPMTQGSLFECLRALSQPAEADIRATAHARQMPPTVPGARRAARILLAEDNPVNRKVVMTILNRLGYQVDAVENGLECVDALRSQAYDLVLMDCQMPELDGYETTRFIRDPDSRVLDHSVPVIALTAHAMPGERERCFAAGMDDYLTKPLQTELLRAALNEWLKVDEEAGLDVPE